MLLPLLSTRYARTMDTFLIKGICPYHAARTGANLSPCNDGRITASHHVLVVRGFDLSPNPDESTAHLTIA